MLQQHPQAMRGWSSVGCAAPRVKWQYQRTWALPTSTWRHPLTNKSSCNAMLQQAWRREGQAYRMDIPITTACRVAFSRPSHASLCGNLTTFIHRTAEAASWVRALGYERLHGLTRKEAERAFAGFAARLRRHGSGI